MMAWISDPEAWVALATLTSLEIILGIDNIIFISLLVGRLPKESRHRGRIFGLGLAMLTRILLLLSLTWVMSLTTPLFRIFNQAITGRGIILIGGGLFLLVKSTREIHNSLEGEDATMLPSHNTRAAFLTILLQIAVIDIVFSLDSVITAVGMANQLMVMILAIVISVLIMMVSSKGINNFIDEHPTIKMLALSFLVLVGVVLVADGLEFHVPKAYVYFAMSFSFAVEMLNIRLHRTKQKKVGLKLHKSQDFDTLV